MKDLARRVLDGIEAAGAGYGDVRVGRTRFQDISVKNGRVDGLSEDFSEGFGVRVLVDGAWGFACSSVLSGEEADRVVAQAVDIARASARAHLEPVTLGDPVRERGSYKGPVRIDPFSVGVDRKIDLLLAAEKELRRDPSIRVAAASAECTHWVKLFASTEGAEVEQEAWEAGAGITATAVSDAEMQRRSYPNSFGRQVGQGGWELVEEMRLVENAPRVADEAAALLTAERCPSITTTLILDASQLALQTHESCGHPTELDRVYGTEAAYAGTSFMTPDLLGTLKYGSDKITIVADATVPGALGTFGYDDEGTPAQRVDIVKEGRWVGVLSGRDSAAVAGLPPGGMVRGDGYNRLPMVRMTNVGLVPGESSLEEIIAATDDGILMATNRSWSIDDKRLNFQFGCEIAWEITGGRLGRMLKNPTYTGITPQFWATMDRLAGGPEWIHWGVPNCGKGQPMQTAHTGHSAAPARFRGVRVGVR